MDRRAIILNDTVQNAPKRYLSCGIRITPTVTWVGYVATPDVWNRTLQNWQSESLAVGCMVVFSIFLRQRVSYRTP